MKRIILLSTLAVVSVCGYAFISNQPITETQKPVATVVNVTPIVEQPIIETTKVEEATVESTTIIPEPVKIETQQELDDRLCILLYENFVIKGDFAGRPAIPRFIAIDLRTQYPEKFNSENLQSTMDYLVEYFSGMTSTNFADKVKVFHW